MSIDTTASATGDAITRERVKQRHFKLPVTLAVGMALVWLMAFVFGRDGVSTYRLGDRTSSIDLGDVGIPTAATVTACAIVLALLTAYAFWAVATFRKVGLWVPIVFAILAVFAFLTWSAADGLVPVTGLLFGAVSLSVPLVFGALGGVIGERAGVVNVAIEAQFLFAAFSSAVIASMTGSVLLGLVAAMVAGALVGSVLAVFSIKYLVEQVIIGVVLNVLIIGLTSFLHGALLTPNSEALNSPPRFP